LKALRAKKIVPISEVVGRKIVEDLEAALAQFRGVVTDLSGSISLAASQFLRAFSIHSCRIKSGFLAGNFGLTAGIDAK
jgi:hypothetical protein